MSPVEDAVVRVVCPVAVRVPPTFVLPDVVRLVVDAFVRLVCPDTVSVVACVVPRVDDPEMREVTDGLGDREMVDVPEKRMLAPGVRYDTGVL